MTQPKPGQELLLDRAASVQFALRPIRFRVGHVLPDQAPWGWVWLAGYQLDEFGQAVARREVLVRLDGLRPFSPARVPLQRRPAAVREVAR